MLKQVTEKALLTGYALDDQEGIANWLARLSKALLSIFFLALLTYVE
jgi:hypothetical protein